MIKAIDTKTARQVVEANHYLHRKPSVSFAFGLFQDETLKGVVTFGNPASHHLLIGVCPTNPKVVIELNRLWVCDSMPRNTESQFVAEAIKNLPPRIIVSYADTSWGHQGYVYRALNFFYAGWTDMERKTPRMDYIAPGKHSRDAFRNGYTHTVRRKPKVKYWTVSGNRRERISLTKLCKWPRLNWKTLPPPKPEKGL